MQNYSVQKVIQKFMARRGLNLYHQPIHKIDIRRHTTRVSTAHHTVFYQTRTGEPIQELNRETIRKELSSETEYIADSFRVEMFLFGRFMAIECDLAILNSILSDHQIRGPAKSSPITRTFRVYREGRDGKGYWIRCNIGIESLAGRKNRYLDGSTQLTEEDKIADNHLLSKWANILGNSGGYITESRLGTAKV